MTYHGHREWLAWDMEQDRIPDGLTPAIGDEASSVVRTDSVFNGTGKHHGSPPPSLPLLNQGRTSATTSRK